MKYFLMMVLLIVPVEAHADWSNSGMQVMTAPDVRPTGQFTREAHLTPNVHVSGPPQRHVEPPKTAVHHTPVVHHINSGRDNESTDHIQYTHYNEPAHHELVRHHETSYHSYMYANPFRDDANGYEEGEIDGQIFFYREGMFFDQEDDGLVAIPPVLGAIVDYIPQDYVVEMMDGVNYLFTRGVYYLRVGTGFEVVEGPGSDQG